MKVLDSIVSYQALRASLTPSMTVGFVPTMGALHVGHAALLSQSVAECDVTVLGIYLNPTQFDNEGDLQKYPETLNADLEMAKNLGVDIVLLPDYTQVYPDDFKYLIAETEFSNQLCGAHRRGHFTGVLTIVMKLLNIVKPQRAYFGQKDFQQYLLIRDMVKAFFLDVEIISCTTVRENDGLALSSRNVNLSEDSRHLAPELHDALISNDTDEEISMRLTKIGFQVDYIETRGERRFGAALIDGVRLIDNVSIDEVAQ